MTRTLVFFHLLGAAVWLGGTITVGALVPALRRAGAERPQLQAMARQFGKVSWAAIGLAARRSSAAQRGAIQGLILLASLAVFAAATGI